MTGLRRVDHRVAADAMQALDLIKRGAGKDKPVSGKVLTRLAGLPSMLRTSGVLPTLAFHAAKSGTGSELEKAYAVVGGALMRQTCQVLGIDAPARLGLGFLQELTEGLLEDPRSHGVVTRRLEEFSGWLRRLAEALRKEQEADAQRRKKQSESAGTASQVHDG